MIRCASTEPPLTARAISAVIQNKKRKEKEENKRKRKKREKHGTVEIAVYGKDRKGNLYQVNQPKWHKNGS